MKIQNLRAEIRANRARVAVTVTWEDCDRPVEELYFETDEAFADDLSCNPHAFLVGCIVPAMHYGEKRVFIDAEICPELRQGLITAMSWLRYWYYEPDRALVQIDAKTQSRPPTPHIPERAGFFFSGGVDSFATLRMNRLLFPSQHSASLRDALIVYGLELDDTQAFAHVLTSLSDVAPAVDLRLISVFTNCYLPYRNEDAKKHFDFWKYQFQGAALSAVAHAFCRRVSRVSIAATFDLPNLGPWGSHPLLDPNYSSHDLWIRHDGLHLSRLEKVSLIASWDSAVRNLRVCNQFKNYKHRELNCGRCEKCIRTMLELFVLGQLSSAAPFPRTDVSVVDIREGVFIDDSYVESCYRDLLPLLIEKGRHDLTSEIKKKLTQWRRSTSPAAVCKQALRKFDAKYLGGKLRKIGSRGRA